MTPATDLTGGDAPEPGADELGRVDPALVRTIVDHAAELLNAASTEAELIDRIRRLEALQQSIAAAQSTLIRAFARTHVAARIASGTVEPEKLERTVAAEVGLACRMSPFEGRTRLRVARDLHAGLDHVRELFAAGELNAFIVRTIVAATADLTPAQRAEVDRLLATHPLAGMGVGRIRDLARSLAAQVAPQAFRARSTTARADRRVTLRPAPDGMTDLIAHLPVEQGVACLAALRKVADRAAVSREPVTRGRGQIMADTLVERLTGQGTAEQVRLEVQVVVPVETLVDPASPLPAHISGYGPVPVELLSTADGRTTWRRLVTRDGIVIGGDSQRRRFGGALAALIRARDGQRCREPYCDAPGREVDHLQRSADGGRTEFTNSRAVCTYHNQLREQPGWSVTGTSDDIRTTTPTGHTYRSPASAVPPFTRQRE